MPVFLFPLSLPGCPSHHSCPRWAFKIGTRGSCVIVVPCVLAHLGYINIPLVFVFYVFYYLPSHRYFAIGWLMDDWWMIDGCEMLSCPVWILFDNQMEMQSLSFPQLLFSRKFQIKFCKFQTPQSFIDTPVCLLIQFKSVSSVGFVCLSVFHPFCLFLRCTSTFSTQCRRYPSVDQFIW